ncbi:MAG: imidazole glycerol phosphate synthase subunit HisH [Parasphingorhabdus sp.]|nr:imidazole glycerol phosphate synthase subunit HisH [Parasphingorhabdus sp.]
MSERIALIDYGAGNLHSVHNALKAAGAKDVCVTADPGDVHGADRVVLPGVGAFGACAGALRAIPDMVDALEDAVLSKGTPFLGICVGMQLMADSGIEFGRPRRAGLGISGTLRCAITSSPSIKIPHMGWNSVEPCKAHGILEVGEAYFLHGFQYDVADPHRILATTDHGGEIVAAVERDNMIGVQFHPEKSQRYGIEFLTRFLAWRH